MTVISKDALLAASCLFASIILPSKSYAKVLNFNDLGSAPAFFTFNYNGFQFGTNSIITTAWFHATEQSQFYTPRSGAGYISTDFQIYDGTAYEPTQPISRSADFIFEGAYFSGNRSIGYRLYYGSGVVFTSAPWLAPTSTPSFVASGYSGFINSVVVVGRQGFYALDDFTFRNTAATPGAVPEPTSWALMLIGFGGIGFAMRRRKTKVITTVAYA